MTTMRKNKTMTMTTRMPMMMMMMLALLLLFSLGVLCKGHNPVIEAFFNLGRRNFYDGVDNNHDDFSCE